MSFNDTEAVIGIIGGGQLGRMLGLSAAQLGIKTVILSPDHAPPAAQVAHHHIQAAYDDQAALEDFCAQISVATFEFENLPASALKFVQKKTPLFPSTKALEVAQDRLSEKDFLNATGIPTAPYRAVDSLAELIAAVKDIGIPAVLKTRRFGYDGKGQMIISAQNDVQLAWDALRSAPGGLILEGFIQFQKEISVITVRHPDGQLKSYDPIWNTHDNHILSTSTVPVGLDQALLDRATDQAEKLATALDYVGVLTVEYFVTDVGILANEIAPRVHNSGHWTIEGATISQFENHIRAILGWPLGDTDTLGQVHMKNLIGRDIDTIEDIARDGDAHIHLYGKGAPRLGRKMGHVTWVTQDIK